MTEATSFPLREISMKWTKKEVGLLITVLGILFILSNIAANFIMIRYYDASMLHANEYKTKKSALIIQESDRSVPHPFYGLTWLNWQPLANNLTNEPLIGYISPKPPEKEIKVLVLGGSVA